MTEVEKVFAFVVLMWAICCVFAMILMSMLP